MANGAKVGHAQSPATRHIDLIRTDWLQTEQRTRSLTAQHLYFYETHYNGV